MATANILVSDFVSVSVYVEPTNLPYTLFGVPLAVSDEGVIDVTERVRTYSSLAGVAGDFGSSGAVYGAATVFFDQSPTPRPSWPGDGLRPRLRVFSKARS